MKNKNELDLFAHPLVLGASISAGYGTRDGGIGAVLAKSINPEAKILNKALSGATSVQSTSHLDLSKFDPSVVLGLDLFFWDAARMKTGKAFEANTKKLFTAFKDTPMIIAKVPVIDVPFLGGKIRDLIESAKKVNDLLANLAVAHSRCLLYDPVPCFMSMGFGSPKYFLDGLHLNSDGNKFAADFFIKSGEHRKLYR